jgi:hypothetical protein
MPRGSPVLAAFALLAAAATAQGPAGGPGIPPKAPPDSPPAAGEKRPAADQPPPPAGAVLVPYEMIKGSLSALPFYWVPAKTYQKLEERIKELERRLRPDRLTAHSCRLTGKVEGDFVVLQADLKLDTDRPRTQVALGFQGAVLSADPELDSRLPVITYGADDGYVVQVAKAGSHHLVLQLKLPVTALRQESLTGATERGFELGLPGAAVTLLTLELPHTVREARWNGSAYKAAPGRPGVWEIPLGRTRNLKLSWREPAPMPGGGPALAAHWDVSVTLQEDEALTEARLTVNDRRPGVGEWRVWAPPGAVLKVVSPEAGPYEVGPAGGDGTFIIKGPPAERLEMQVTARRPRPFPRLAVGPFLLLGADRQEGVVDVRASAEALRGFRLVYHRQGNVRQQDVKETAGDEVKARFQYVAPPEAARPGAPRRAPLEVELKAVVALIETSVEHTLRLGPVEDGWQVLAETRIHATPLHNGADFLEVLLPRPRPAALQALAVPAAGPPAPLASRLLATVLPLAADRLGPVRAPADYQCESPAGTTLERVAGRSRARLQLPRPELQKFTVVLKERYLLPSDAAAARLELPRPLTALDRGGVVRVQVDARHELIPPGGDGEAAAADRQHYTVTSAAAPAYVDLAWRPYRADVPVTLVADVTTRRRYAQAREEVRLPDRGAAGSKGGALRSLRLHRAGRVSTPKVTGGRLVSFDRGSGLAQVEAAGDSFVLEYDFPLPPRAGEAGRTFAVPLFWPVDATRAETKVRVWCEPGTVPLLPDLPPLDEFWKDRGSEAVAGKGSLPALVLEGEGKDLPLTLRLLDSSLPPLVDVLADRALIQVAVDEDGARSYRARFLLTKLDAEHLDIEFPVPLPRLAAPPRVLLGGKALAWQAPAAGGKTARVRIPRGGTGQFHLPVVLEVSYKLPADYPERDGVLRTALHPPALVGDVFVGRVRWQVVLPASWVGLPPGGQAAPEQRWGRRGWLLAPEPVATGQDLEEWLTGKDGSGAPGPAGLVFWGAGLEPVALVHFPRLLWLCLCSGALLLAGVALLAAPLPRPAFGLAVAVLALMVAAAGLTWPGVFPLVAYGCEPGALVLALLLAVQWFLQRRYQRRVVFMPGFTRARPSSSLSRGSSSQRPREVSTIDAPPGAASSAGKSTGSAKEVTT